MSDKIPRFSYDLIDLLDKETPAVEIPMTQRSWGQMSESTLRELAFVAGMRAMVDQLVAWKEEIENEQGGDNPDPKDDDRGPFGRVLSNGLSEHRTVPPTIRARRF
jgi:hypothetical protein